MMFFVVVIVVLTSKSTCTSCRCCCSKCLLAYGPRFTKIISVKAPRLPFLHPIRVSCVVVGRTPTHETRLGSRQKQLVLPVLVRVAFQLREKIETR
jgi:hypothetical protein